MFKKILIANRGEIACRVAATARRMGIRTVAVYSDVDAQAAHVAACDEAVWIGGAAPKDSYLRAQVILEAAKRTGAQAIHPGYGFLSENADFAQACADAGLVFIGPPPAAIRAMGLKAESKALMAAAGVPLVPGYHGADQDPALLQREADRIGYPVLIKASAGGGGKGMRVVTQPADFAAALASCQREAINSFGNDAVLIERYVTRPRHIEIQVFADTQGHVVSLFERDCSVQRRHQKVLEEAPAPGMSELRRIEMGEAAQAAARAVGYVGAGTVEFIAEPQADGDLRFYFMEMNTRLQVEHPVTEAITGQDLVAWQLMVAAGQPLPLTQAQLVRSGHAIEARICAENPDAQFLPATGRLVSARWPEHVSFQRNADNEPMHQPAAVRIDAGVRAGDEVTPHYDPMVAKLIVWGEDRAQALARLDQALTQTHLTGLQTNVAFLRRLIATRSFSAPDLDTALIEREHEALFAPGGLPWPVAAAGVLAMALSQEAQGRDGDPWSATDSWRLHGSVTRSFDFEVAGEHRQVALVQMHRGAQALAVQGEQWAWQWQRLDDRQVVVWLQGQRHVLAVDAHDDEYAVFGQAGSVVVKVHDPLAEAGRHGQDGGRLTAPMPGKVSAWLVAAGASVKAGTPLVVLEAMKMEHTLTAPRDGVVAELLYAVGDQVADGSELLTLAEATVSA